MLEAYVSKIVDVTYIVDGWGGMAIFIFAWLRARIKALRPLRLGMTELLTEDDRTVIWSESRGRCIS